MKKTLMFIMLAVSLTAFGQKKTSKLPILYQGVRLGLSFNNYVGDDANIVDADVNKGEYEEVSKGLGNRVGWHAGYVIAMSIPKLKNCYVEAGAYLATKGYKVNKTLYNDEAQYNHNDWNTYDVKMVTYNIDIPICFGYNYVINDKMSVRGKTGPYFTYALSGKQNYSLTSYADAEFDGSDEIETKISDMDNFNKFGIGWIFGAEFCYDKYVVGLSYQHGLTKLFEKTKMYESNIGITLGMNF